MLLVLSFSARKGIITSTIFSGYEGAGHEKQS